MGAVLDHPVQLRATMPRYGCVVKTENSEGLIRRKKHWRFPISLHRQRHPQRSTPARTRSTPGDMRRDAPAHAAGVTAAAAAAAAREQDGAVLGAEELRLAAGENPSRHQPTTTPLCRHWSRSGSCLYGDECRFRHDDAGGGGGAGGGGRGGGTSADKARNRTRHHVRNRSKAGAFRRWLVDTFGVDTLRGVGGGGNADGGGGGSECHQLRGDETGVLDIAGGKGELAFELQNLSGVPVTVIDPRPMRLDKYVKRFRKGFYHRNGAPAMEAGGRRPMGSALKAPRHLRLFFHDGLFDARKVPDVTARRAAAKESWELANNTRWSCRGLVGVGDNDGAEGIGDKVEDDGGGNGDGDGSRTLFLGLAKGDGGRGDVSSGRHADYMRRGAPLRQRNAFSTTVTGATAEGAVTTIAVTIAAAAAAEKVDVAAKVDDADDDAAAAAAAGEDDGDATSEAAADSDACEPVALDAASTSAALETLLERCTVVVGLHTDQATDAAVDYALSHGGNQKNLKRRMSRSHHAVHSFLFPHDFLSTV